MGFKIFHTADLHLGMKFTRGYPEEDGRVSSMMIEVNRKVYMDEKTGEKIGSFEDVRNTMSDLIHSVAIPYALTQG